MIQPLGWRRGGSGVRETFNMVQGQEVLVGKNVLSAILIPALLFTSFRTTVITQQPGGPTVSEADVGI